MANSFQIQPLSYLLLTDLRKFGKFTWIILKKPQLQASVSRGKLQNKQKYIFNIKYTKQSQAHSQLDLKKKSDVFHFLHIPILLYFRQYSQHATAGSFALLTTMLLPYTHFLFFLIVFGMKKLNTASHKENKARLVIHYLDLLAEMYCTQGFR